MAKPRSSRQETPADADLNAELDRVSALSIIALRAFWHQQNDSEPPVALSKDMLARELAYRIQEQKLGGIDTSCRKLLASIGRGERPAIRWLKIGTVIVRSHAGVTHEVVVTPEGFSWRGKTYTSLSSIALQITGTSWSGSRFFGLSGSIKPATQNSTNAEIYPFTQSMPRKEP